MTGKPWRTVGAVGLFVAASACSTVDPDAVRGDPAALVVAITDVEHGERLAVDAGGLGFRGGASKFHDVLLATLTKYGAASDVIVWQEGSEVFPDVLITPVIERAEPFVHEGVSSGFWASGLLWLGTWIGGLAVDDSNYDTNLVVRFDVRDAVSDFEIQAVNASGGMVSTSFLDRNSFFSWSTVQALILPPFWTSDDIESASVELTDRAVTNASVELVRFLKSEFEPRCMETSQPSFTILDPDNGARLPVGEAKLRFRLESRTTPFSALTISVNGQAVSHDEEVTSIPPSRPGQPHRLDHECMIPLELGDNFVRLEFVAGSTFTRTLRLIGQ